MNDGVARNDEQLGLALQERMARVADDVAVGPDLLDGARRRYRRRRMRAVRLTAAVATVAAVAIGVTALTGGVPGVGRGAGPADPVAPNGPHPTISLPTAATLADYDRRFGREYPLPFDAYEVSTTERIQAEAAEQVLEDRCMIAKGYAYRADKDVTFAPYWQTANLIDSGEYGHRRLFGPTSAAAAQAYGLGEPSDTVLPAAPVQDPAYTAGFRADTPGLKQAFEACRVQASTHFEPQQLPRYQAFPDTLKDPQYRLAAQAYAGCMSLAGYPQVGPPSQLDQTLQELARASTKGAGATTAPSLSPSSPSSPSSGVDPVAGRKIAVASVACVQQSGLVDTWWRVWTRLEQAYLAGHRAELARVAAWKDRQVAFARRVLSGQE